VFEQREVLHERWQLHVERRCQFSDGGWSDGQSFQDLSPGRVGQGVKHFVSDCGLSHLTPVDFLG
jgi:hypothetical protein